MMREKNGNKKKGSGAKILKETEYHLITSWIFTPISKLKKIK
jgi:hypothetical protein